MSCSCSRSSSRSPPAAGATTSADGDRRAATTASRRAGRDGGCETVEAPEPKPDGGQEAPTDALDAGKTYQLVVETNCGSFTIQLDQETAPKTAASLVSLAESGFFDGTTFHRVVPGFVIQGGDPTGTGTGGPGYKTVDVPPPDAAYTQGVVAMAKAGTEAPGHVRAASSSSSPARTSGLPPEYAVVGKVTEGIETVRAIDSARRRRRAAVAAGRDREGHGRVVLIGAVVLAAGAATRFGAPKQRLLLPAVLERLTGVDQVVVVAGAHRSRAPSHCPDWERGPGASLRCGLAALAAGRRGGRGRPRGRPRARAGRDRARARSLARERRAARRRELRRRARPSARRRPLGVGRHPGRGPARARAAARPVRRPRRARRRRRSRTTCRKGSGGRPTNRCRHRWSSSARSRSRPAGPRAVARPERARRPRGCTGS